MPNHFQPNDTETNHNPVNHVQPNSIQPITLSQTTSANQAKSTTRSSQTKRRQAIFRRSRSATRMQPTTPSQYRRQPITLSQLRRRLISLSHPSQSRVATYVQPITLSQPRSAKSRSANHARPTNLQILDGILNNVEIIENSKTIASIGTSKSPESSQHLSIG